MLFAMNIVYAGDKSISFTDLPEKAQTFFKSYFSNLLILTVSMESEYFFQKQYAILLKDGSKIKFGSDGDWSKIVMKGKAIPAKIVPTAILQYLHKSFPNTFVTEIEKTRSGYDVDISNGLDLEFSRNGKFLRIDD